MNIIKKALSIKHNKILYDYLNEIEAKQRKISDEIMISKFKEETSRKNSLENFKNINNNVNNNNTDSNLNLSTKVSKFYSKIEERNPKEIVCFNDNNNNNENKGNDYFFFKRIFKIVKIIFMYGMQYFKKYKGLVYFLLFLAVFFKRNFVMGILKRIFFTFFVQRIRQ